MNIVFAEERYRDIYQEFAPLYDLHYEEIAEHKDAIALDMDYDRYFNMDETGVLVTITVRDADKDNQLIGYYKLLITPHLHYKESITAATDIFFIHPEYRKHGIGKALFEYAIESARSRGVQRMYASYKIAHDVSGIMREVGLEPIEVNCAIVFEKEE